MTGRLRAPTGRYAGKTAAERQAERRRRFLDAALHLFGDAPGYRGTTVAALVGSWLVWEARNLGMSKLQMARMFGNVGIDWALGIIPFVGAVPDFFFRSNTHNLRIIRRHLDKHHPATATIIG